MPFYTESGPEIRLRFSQCDHGPLTRYVKLGLWMRRECRECFPRHRLQREPLVNDPGMNHDTCVTYVPWCMSGSLTRGGGENVPGIPGACTTRNFAYLVRSPHQTDNESNAISLSCMLPDRYGISDLNLILENFLMKIGEHFEKKNDTCKYIIYHKNTPNNRKPLRPTYEFLVWYYQTDGTAYECLLKIHK